MRRRCRDDRSDLLNNALVLLASLRIPTSRRVGKVAEAARQEEDEGERSRSQEVHDKYSGINSLVRADSDSPVNPT